jgi:hypothetical protein
VAFFALTEVSGPSCDASRARREHDGWQEHAALMDSLAADGSVVLGGPTGHPTRSAGPWRMDNDYRKPRPNLSTQAGSRSLKYGRASCEPLTPALPSHCVNPSQSQRGSGWADLASLAAPVTAILALGGVAWFALLSLGAGIVYDSVGVQPREVGLSSGTLLGQSAIGLAVVIVVVVVLERIFYFLVQAAAVSPDGSAAPTRKRSLSPTVRLATTLLTVSTLATLIVLLNALDAKSDLKAGRRPTSALLPGLPSPWRGEIAKLAWSDKNPSGFGALPSCALYLGQADSTAVFYDPAKRRALRIPNSMVIVTTRRDVDRCR